MTIPNDPAKGEHGQAGEIAGAMMMLTASQMLAEGYPLSIPYAIGEGFRVFAMLMRHEPEVARMLARWYEDDGKSTKASAKRAAREWCVSARAIIDGKLTVPLADQVQAILNLNYRVTDLGDGRYGVTLFDARTQPEPAPTPS